MFKLQQRGVLLGCSRRRRRGNEKLVDSKLKEEVPDENIDIPDNKSQNKNELKQEIDRTLV
ncbi:hypothetical protein MKW92_042914, partial [Papaver armeniacum]